ncbi:hypothetical protein [Testudinibacter sp. TR-2022]|uniref:hypothetical protein n=1 Tax=Testudinibacter sp. TR-2022 TaxID=2585029 RepID=UPI00159B8BBC|nr:hypothetical protein [Testudinibacter sp. TR-2022]
MTDLTLTEQQAAQALAAKQMTQDKAQAYEMLGMLKMSSFTKKLVTVTEIKLLNEIKETKKYKGLALIDSNGKSVTCSNFQEFCSHLGMSYEKVNLDIQNLNILGEDFLETSQRLGLGYRDLRKLRQLPEAERTEIVEADYSEATDKEDLLEKIEDLTAQHAKTKAELESRLKRKSDDYEAQSKVLANKNQRIDQLDTELAKKSKLIDTMPPEKKGEALRDEVNIHAYSCEAQLRGQMRLAFEALMTHSEETGMDHKQFMIGCLAQVELAINQLRGEFGLDSEHYTGYAPKWVEELVKPEDRTKAGDETTFDFDDE